MTIKRFNTAINGNYLCYIVINKKMLQVTEISHKLFVVKRRKRDPEFVLSVGKRIKEAMGDMSYTALAKKIGVKPNTIWDYVNGVSLPNPELLSKISDILSVSVDYFLKGQQSLFAKDEIERDTLYIVREAQEFGGSAVAEKIPQYGRFIIKEVKKPKSKSDGKGRAIRLKAGSG